MNRQDIKQKHATGTPTSTQDLRHGHQRQRSDNERKSGVSLYMIANELQLCDGDGMMEISWTLIARVETPTRAHPHMCKQQ